MQHLSKVALCAIFMASAFMTLHTHAQDIPDPTEELRRNQERLREQQERARPRDVRPPGRVETLLKTLPMDEPRCQIITSVVIQGLPLPLSDLGKPLLDPQNEVGRCYGIQAIAALRERMQERLMARGYITSTVIVPEQNLSAGTLRLQVLMGQVHRMHHNSGSSPGQRISLRNTFPIAAGDWLNLRDIEQGLDNLKRIPGVQADVQLEPAADVNAGEGSSDLRVQFEQTQSRRIAFYLDDAGDEQNGKYQAAASAYFDNLSGVGDMLSVTAGLNPGAQNPMAYKSRNNSLQYNIPWGYWSLELGLATSAYRQTIQGLNQDYEYRGTTANNDIKLSRIVHRDGDSKTSASLKAWQRQSNNYVDDTEVQVQRRKLGGWEAAINHKQYLPDGQWSLTATYRRGTRNFGAEPIAEELFGEGTGLMGILWLDAWASLPLPSLPGQWRYDGSFRLQKAHTRLIAQDRFTLGGRSSVRGFSGQTVLAGENGWYLRNDFSHRLPWGNASFYLGLDLGQVSGASTPLQTGTALAGAVLGLRGQWGPAQVDVFIGAPLHKPQAFRADKAVAGFSASLNF